MTLVGVVQAKRGGANAWIADIVPEGSDLVQVLLSRETLGSDYLDYSSVSRGSVLSLECYPRPDGECLLVTKVLKFVSGS